AALRHAQAGRAGPRARRRAEDPAARRARQRLAEDELSELGELIRGLAAQTSLVIVEHHMDLMMSVCDSLVVLDFGKVISRGSPREVQADPAVTAAYLGVSGREGDEDE